ncbi:MarR family winged helix-turn-helix transcriptional regulator [Streptomyces sp. A1136]|uniref:MarR family winged helix-turn-helix transcriptional regulator n=1 Tax=Streptomyces sp. A1136 TaxID=2563102 RepID=UPI00109E9E01|nr:MarR family transcriptional regulator [Streptomyces sp. A1136]THA49404.1 MarR family transcriptional regulator [Streptomyces sp. A1136]
MNEQSLHTGFLAWHFAQAMGARLEKELRTLGLNLAQYNALQHAEHQPGISSADAARHAGITAQSMGPAVASLTSRGLLSRSPHPTNRRILCLHSTPDGSRLLEQARDVVRRVNEEALAVLEPEERTAVHHLLHRLVIHLNPGALPPTAGPPATPDP